MLHYSEKVKKNNSASSWTAVEKKAARLVGSVDPYRN